MDATKIANAAALCLGYALGTRAPYSRVTEYIEKLKADPSWTPEELVEVQTQVIRTLMSVMAAAKEESDRPMQRPGF